MKVECVAVKRYAVVAPNNVQFINVSCNTTDHIKMSLHEQKLQLLHRKGWCDLFNVMSPTEQATYKNKNKLEAKISHYQSSRPYSCPDINKLHIEWCICTCFKCIVNSRANPFFFYVNFSQLKWDFKYFSIPVYNTALLWQIQKHL